MRKTIILLATATIGLLPVDANATLQCVTYAREVTGMNLKGDAWQWWEAADGVYSRGDAPRDGAVLVFKRQGSMVHGHVAVVRKTTSPRVVLVDHANWAPRRSSGRGKVAEAVPVMDVSAKNDWSEVRVWYEPTNQFGDRVYKTRGFVYRPGNATQVRAASLRDLAPRPAKPATVQTAVVPEPAAERPSVPAVIAPVPVSAAASAVNAPEPSAPVQRAPEAAPVAPAGAATESGKFDARPWAEHA